MGGMCLSASVELHVHLNAESWLKREIQDGFTFFGEMDVAPDLLAATDGPFATLCRVMRLSSRPQWPPFRWSLRRK